MDVAFYPEPPQDTIESILMVKSTHYYICHRSIYHFVYMQAILPEKLIIRPPNEWRSMLIRVTRGCAWNRCRFCGIYPHLGQPDFSIRSTADIKRDIDLFSGKIPEIETAFMGDADPLCIPLDDFEDIAAHLRKRFPHLKRLTAYTRASTLYRIRKEGIIRLARAGLNRVHVGLESGNRLILRQQRKGLSPGRLIETAVWLKEAGIELSLYVLLGLGGKNRWQEHIDDTAAILNKVAPEFIRIRRLWLYHAEMDGTIHEAPLWKEIQAGTFIPQTPEGTVLELRRLVAGLSCEGSFLTCDHANNYVRISGSLPERKQAMLAAIDEFLNRPEEERMRWYEEAGSEI